MKKLTQAVFDGAPDWVKSAAVDSTGALWFHNVGKSKLMVVSGKSGGHWYLDRNLSFEEWCVFHLELSGNNYDTTNWQLSAIDREVKK